MRKPATKLKPATAGGINVEDRGLPVEGAPSTLPPPLSAPARPRRNEVKAGNPQPSTLQLPRFPAWLLALLLALATIALYWPATHHDFVNNYDDEFYVTANVHVQGGLTWENVKWAFVNPVAANWHPVTILSHMLDCQLFGLKPWGHHLTNLLLHALNTVLVFVLLLTLTQGRAVSPLTAALSNAGERRARSDAPYPVWRSALVAALFGLHPLHVESVAWVAERKDVLSCFFFLLTLLAYTRYAWSVTSDRWQVAGSEKDIRPPLMSPVTRHPSLFYLLSLFFFSLGLMSKPMLVTVPCVLLLLDYWPLNRMWSADCGLRITNFRSLLSHVTRHTSLFAEKIPFIILAEAACFATFAAQGHGGAVMTAEDFPPGARIGNALISYCRYLGKMFWPTDMAVFYPHPVHWPSALVLLAGVFLCGVSLILFLKRGRHPFLLTGWLWYIGTLVPVIGLVQVGGQAMADRYMYIPSLGVLILTVWGAYELARRWRYRVIALSLAGSAAIVLCFAVTRHQLGYWQDGETLFRHALDVTENNWVAHINLGNVLHDKGRFDEAIIQYREAISLQPDVFETRRSLAVAHYNLGIALLAKGQTNEAISQYQEAVRLKPDYVLARSNLGRALLKTGRTDEAISQFQEIVLLEPDDAVVHVSLGNALFSKGRTDEAVSQFQEAIRLKPDDSVAHYNLGDAFFKQGRIDEAIGQFQEAVRLKPDDANAQGNLAKILEWKRKSNARTPDSH